jgi:hypothetical protein
MSELTIEELREKYDITPESREREKEEEMKRYIADSIWAHKEGLAIHPDVLGDANIMSKIKNQRARLV